MHRRKLLKKALAAFLAVNLIVTSSSMAFAGNNDNNSADVNYENETTDTGSRYVATGYRQLDEEYQIIPDVLSNDNSSIDGMDITKAATYPAAYRTENLPAVRDQGIYGVCWSFSTISLIETNLIKKNLASSDIDLSELHLVNYTYNCVNDPLGGLEGDVNKFDTSYGSVMQYGGNVEMAANSLLDWEGAVNEDVVPYTIDYIRQVENEQLNDSLAYGKDVAHVQNFYRVNITSRDDVKKAVMDYGAVSISYWSDQSSDWSTDNYNSSTAAYYCPNAYTSNHAVTIVGWDDDYSADNFATTPDGNGAWIVRNSWGSYYGKEGYFYLSYYDKSIYTVGYALEAELSNNYDNNYQYDGAMLYGYMGYGGSNKYANIFEAKANQDGSENIKAVSFMTGRSTNLNYTVSIYTNLTDETNPESGTLAAQKSGITTYDGTYTVNLDSPVEINEGNKFSVVVEVRNASGKTSYLAYERSMQSGKVGYWCTASAKENQSFVANPYGYWEDFGKARSCNFIIKAFTDNETQTPVVEVESVSLNKSEMTLTEGESETLAATVTPENAENKSIIWSSNNEAVATVDANGTVIAKRAGTAVITATSTNGKSAGCTVTVEKKQIPVTEVRLSESTVGIVEGSTYKLTATVLPENTTDSKNVSWSSNNEAVATVDANGNVTAKRAGTAVITATSTNGKSAGCTVTVEKKQIPVTEVRLSESTVGIVEGSTYKLTATVLPENTTDSKNVSWSSNNEAVATVDANGNVTAKRAGTAVITATSTNGKSAGCTVTVEKKQIPVTEVRLSESTVGIVEGSTYKLTATVLPENTTDSKNVSWSSNNEAVATVDANGNVTAKRAGTAVITATSTNGKTAGCTVTVSKKEIPITEISLDKSSATLTEGETTTLTATVLPENTTYGKSVKWSSSNVAVATVDLMGKVTAKRAGTAIITAISENGKTASCTITVNKKDTNITITEVRLNKSTETLKEGDTTTLTATVLPENTTDSKSVSWRSSNSEVATVDANGTVTAKRAGTAVITATSTNGKTAGCTVTVSKKEIPITEISLDKSSATLTEGETTTLTATVLPENTTDSKNVSWRSSNSEVATVDANGTVTAKRAGTAVITATSTNGKTAGCTVTVSKKEIPITEISLDKSSATLTEGETTTLTATVLPENTTDSKSVSWSSSNSEVATVDANGTVTAKRAGTAVITATSTNGKTAGCTVTVSKKEIPITEISLDKSSATLTEGETTTLTATVLPENTTYGKSVKWSSSNVAVATVDLMGKVTAKRAGTAIITATSENGKTASCTVTVNKKDTYTGLRDVDGNWMYFENGNVNSDYAGLVNYEGLWFYVDNGTIDWGYTGLADYNGIWFYVSGGIVDWNYTGLTYYNDVWFYISGGMIDWDYTGLVYYNDIWFYVSGGILDWDYIGLTSYNGIWFMISGGMINWDYAGLVYYNDMWFYVSGGTINWDYAGLIYYNDAWFYVSGGTINWTTAIVDYNGAKFYVQNGMVDWDYTGTVNYNGSTYNVINGMVY